MSTSRPDRIAELEKRKAHIEAQLVQHKARQLKQDKKRTDRLKVLLGAFLLSDMQRNPKLRTYVARHIFDFYTRKRDRDFLAICLAPLLEEDQSE